MAKLVAELRFEIPKEEWGPGPWQDEPDRVEFEYAGFPCLLAQGPLGNWCGYVGVSPGHRWHGRDFADIEDADAHGGLTYSDACQGHICHVPKPGEPENVWWLGFDFGHAWDVIPSMGALHRSIGAPPKPKSLAEHEHYWTTAEARAETARLAEQAACNDT